MAARASIRPKKQEPQSAPQEPESISLDDRIRARAYELYLQRGGEEGSHLTDWLQAETEIKQTVEPEQNFQSTATQDTITRK